MGFLRVLSVMITIKKPPRLILESGAEIAKLAALNLDKISVKTTISKFI